MSQLKLIVFDQEDLSVLSAHLQDAVLKVGDMTYLPAEKRFAAVLRRFDWQAALAGAEGSAPRPSYQRRQTAVRFERVLAAKVSGLDLKRKSDVLSLLAIEFRQARPDDPAGSVTLVFSGGGAIRLEVECIEAELKDLGLTWRSRSRPRHPVDDEA
jgi:hypothetical protein